MVFKSDGEMSPDFPVFFLLNSNSPGRCLDPTGALSQNVRNEHQKFPELVAGKVENHLRSNDAR